ncbi:hypothetical protein [Granulicella tundricola]|uniref:Uncharacterized protein n=1 Tax=Granulicella tundricola (strain ATCC BAA-1859 / DSM 23138 / MP5ACTX9) TaxID=1198114 RepID=E8WWV8_GRATM|nr:hypothetical protein [Granulicella tundricola]ADW67436.1 hypothetical protein AciX9_0364 [Granulicella tundricola MP5ACTX9]
MKLTSLFLAVSLAVAPVSAAFAQHTTYAQRHSIRARQTNQQARINHGVRDGQITPKGAAHAEANQARISSEEHSMRAADNGHLTAQDRHTVARQQDRTSKGIYDRNHNGYTDPGVTPK